MDHFLYRLLVTLNNQRLGKHTVQERLVVVLLISHGIHPTVELSVQRDWSNMPLREACGNAIYELGDVSNKESFFSLSLGDAEHRETDQTRPARGACINTVYQQSGPPHAGTEAASH